MRRLIAIVSAGAVLGAMLNAPPAGATAAARPGYRPALQRLQAARDTGSLGFHRLRTRNQAASRSRPTEVTWPSPASAVIRLVAPAPPRVVTAKGTPLFAAPAGIAGEPGRVAMAVLSHRAAVVAGVRGVLFTARAAGTGGQARIGLSYARFSQVSGGNYGLSLGLAELPACALTTPGKAACRKARPLKWVNDGRKQTVSAVVTLPPGGRRLVLAAASTFTDGGGAAGTYNATSLRPSGTWSAGGSSGSFDYSYPMAAPPAAGNLAPQLGLNYDSGSVDGQIASTQAQSSWVGDGWSTPQSYVEQSFTPCQDNPEGSAAPQSTADECYDGPVLTLSLNGSSTPLVCPVPFSYTRNSTCTAATDDGDVITHHVSSGNGQGTKFTDYWTVTTRDGTTYSFGLNRLPGWTSGDTATNSVDYEPVFSAHSGDPCYDATFSSSYCTMAYRWNLDYVTDLHDNAMAYYYDQDTNAYLQYGKTSAVSYIRDSHLYHIDYGFTDGHAYDATVPDQALFTTGDRCFAGASSCDPLSSTTASNWQDVPYTQDYCASGSTSCLNVAPSFWSTVALNSVSTGQNCGPPTSSGASTCSTTADSWALAQHFPATGDGTSPALWLDSVTRTGADTTAGGSAVTLPKVSFSGTQLANRVNNATNPWLYRYRITAITTETGSVITVNYELTSPCPAQGPYPTPSNNSESCFPVYWGSFVPGQNGEDWFNKYAVRSVSVSDPAGGSPGLFTSYSYSGAAWHYDDNEVVKTKFRTWGQWRGYQDVQTYAGTGADPQTETEATYYQGMSDDNNTTDVTLADSQGKQHEDANQLQGDVLESTAYLYPGGPVDHSTIDSYWVSSPPAATRDRSDRGLSADPLTANFTGLVEEWSRQALTDSSPVTWRIVETDTSYDTNSSSPTEGLPLFTFAHGDLSDTSQQRCTTITYAPANTAENLAGLPAETEVDALACGGSNPNGSSVPGTGQVNALTAPSGRAQSNIVSDTRVFYDNPALATTWPQPASPAWPQAAPTAGDVSVVRQDTGFDGTSFSYQTMSTRVYDSYGRVVKSYDGNGGFNGTTYTPTVTSFTMTNGSTTSVTVTNPLGQAATTALDPLRDLPVSVTDANGIVTTTHYDGLGRLTGVWKYSRATSSPANEIFSYSLSNTAPPVVTTQVLNDQNGYITSTALFDSLLRPRQTQVPTPQGGMLVTDHFYDSRSWEFKTNDNWWDSSANPGSTIVTIPDSNVADQTVTQYDGLGRAVVVTSYDNSAVKSAAYTLYTGDKVTSVPATGATPTTAATDALGRRTELDSYTAAPSVTTGTNAGGFPTVTMTGGSSQATGYSYETRGWLAGITDAATGEQWTRTYNPLGQVVTSTTPNNGTATLTYDGDSHLLTAKDSLGHTISYTYDPLGRRTGQYDGPNSSSPPIATWVYDNSNNAVSGMADPVGHLTTQSSYDSSGQAYTQQAKGFNAFGEPTGQTWTMPADSSLGALATSYTMTYQYMTNSGLSYKDSYPASPLGTGQTTAALPSEVVTHGYSTGLDLPSTLGSNQGNGYQQNDTFNAFFQIAQTELGSASNNAYITNTFDQHTGALTDSQVKNTAVSSTPFDDTSYSYDPAGDITSEQDVRNGAATELQCFNYDLLGRLTSAWTTAGTQPCSAGPSTGTGGTVGDGITGGAYWTSWTYSPLGDQGTQTQHSVTGGTDTVTTYSYNGNGQNQPDTLTKAVTTGPGAGTATYSFDAAGNTTARDLSSGNQTLNWYDNGKLKSVTTPAGTTSYVYDASGNLLLQKAPGQTTLYIFGEQLVLNTGGGAGNGQVTGIRFIPLPGGGTAVRTGPGTSYSFEVGDQHGTSLLTLDDNAANPTWRQFTPFGGPRGTAPGSWPDSNAFLGDPTSASAGLDIIGARAYDAVLGRFLSVDPVLDAGVPQTMNGYSYAADDPVTQSDPSGLCPDPSVCPSAAQQNHALQQASQAQQAQQNNAVVNWAISGCGNHMECVLQMVRNFRNPNYLQSETQTYFQGQAVERWRAQVAAAQAARQRACSGFWSGLSCWMNNAASSAMSLTNDALSAVGESVNDAVTFVTSSRFLNDVGNVMSWVGVAASFAGAIAMFTPLGPVLEPIMQTVSLITGAASALAYVAAGNKAGATAEMVGTLLGVATGGLGEIGSGLAAKAAARAVATGVDDGTQSFIKGGLTQLITDSSKLAFPEEDAEVTSAEKFAATMQRATQNAAPLYYQIKSSTDPNYNNY